MTHHEEGNMENFKWRSFFSSLSLRCTSSPDKKTDKPTDDAFRQQNGIETENSSPPPKIDRVNRSH
jgi:hypothetical protein